MATRLLLSCLLLAALREAGGLATPLVRMPRSPLAFGHRRCALSMQDGSPEEPPPPAAAQESAAPAPEPESAAVATAQPLPLGPDGQPDLSAMSFDERLAYLSSIAPKEPPPEVKKEQELFPSINIGDADMAWWSPQFLMLCFQDLRDVKYPSFKQVVQTTVRSQIAFIFILIFIVIFDAIADGLAHTLVNGDPFVIKLDGTASGTRGV